MHRYENLQKCLWQYINLSFGIFAYLVTQFLRYIGPSLGVDNWMTRRSKAFVFSIAVDWIFSHDMDIEMAMDAEAASSASSSTPAAPAAEPGHPDGTKYKLVSEATFLFRICSCPCVLFKTFY